MTVRKSHAEWKGDLAKGRGTMSLGSGAFEGTYTQASRFASGEGTNPEELIGAAHAGCFSMFLSAVLSNNGYTPNSVKTTASVHLDRDDTGPVITKIELDTEADVPNLDEESFNEYVQVAKQNCPISRALAGPDISVSASLNS